MHRDFFFMLNCSNVVFCRAYRFEKERNIGENQMKSNKVPLPVSRETKANNCLRRASGTDPIDSNAEKIKPKSTGVKIVQKDMIVNQ